MAKAAWVDDPRAKRRSTGLVPGVKVVVGEKDLGNGHKRVIHSG